MQKSQLVAVDTNVLMRLADGHEATIDAWHLIKRRLHPVQFLLLPTVMEELASKVLEDDDHAVRHAAGKALLEMRTRWRFQPVDFNSVQEAIADNAAKRVRDADLIPPAERNDSLILAEAAVLNVVLLVSRDSHLIDVDRERLALLFRQLDLPTPLISSPENLVKKFYS